MERYDLLIAGGGAAGLSLAYRLALPQWSGLRIGVIEAEVKEGNDRTWCFWEQGEGPFEGLLAHRWDRMDFFGYHGKQVSLNLQPYAYKMLRSGDFYAHCHNALDHAPHIHRIQDRVRGYEKGIGPKGTEILVHMQQKTVQAPLVFASTTLEGALDEARQGLWLNQHFKGYYLASEEPVFEGLTARLMDFRVEQVDGYPCFVYVLPTDAHHALVEYTVFSPDAWTNAAYDAPLHRYMEENLGLRGNFQVLHTEYGQIPMTDYDFEGSWRRRYPDLPSLVPLGTMGGLGRPSTGYTFTNIQRHCELILQALGSGSLLDLGSSSLGDFRSRMPKRFKTYDATLLRVLQEQRYPGWALFERLFDRNPTATLLAFLDGQSPWWKEILIMNSTPRFPMALALWKTLQRP
ncbi:MAG: lycopene cyclase family protein [Bacteroidota bacterium]